MPGNQSDSGMDHLADPYTPAERPAQPAIFSPLGPDCRNEDLSAMRREFLKIWQASQPFLKKPRWWMALVLRTFLRQTTFIAITGSNGKTTATRYLAAILSSHTPIQWTRLNRIPRVASPRRSRFASPGARCTRAACSKRMTCDDCPEFRNQELVQLANEQLTVAAD